MAKPGAKVDATETPIEILEISRGVFSVAVLGLTPIICNRVSQKAAHELLLPSIKTRATRAGTLKHDPVNEFRASPYLDPRADGETRLQVLAASFKKAMSSAALDMPGSATKAEVGRLSWVEGERLPLYGIPQLLMSVTRNSDVNRTPDIRSRCIIPHWACRLTVNFMVPRLTEKSVINLLAGAGMIRGVGDWRPEKGSGTYGQYALVPEDDPTFLAIVKSGGREAQDAALLNPIPYDDETAEMLTWFEAEVKRRGREKDEEKDAPKKKVGKK